MTIDPVDARDFDDAISLEMTDEGHWRLGVHIADVSHFVRPGTPLDQEARFLEMSRLYAAEDEEATPADEDYLRAMRYGMPPCGGCGIGVDRLVMLLTNRSTIREVLLFPHLRERQA